MGSYDSSCISVKLLYFFVIWREQKLKERRKRKGNICFEVSAESGREEKVKAVCVYEMDV